MKRYSKKNNSNTIATLLKNKNVLYIVLFFSVMNLFSYLLMKQLDAVAFFIIIGFLATYFSKNMIVIMLTSVVSTFLLVQINMLGKGAYEGFTEGADPEAKETKDAKEETAAKEDKDETATKAAMGAPPDAVPGKEINGKEREKFSQKLSPASYNVMDDDDEPRHKPKIDYAATLESAYDNLDKLLSSSAIKNMTADTGRLAEKQQLLMGNIEKIAPIMEKAGSILNGFDMGAITKLMSTVGTSSKLLADNQPTE
jgi:hypothetical protein